MTKRLKKAFDKVSSLPPAEQNAIAERILTELSMDEQWDKTLAESADVLERLAAEALDLHERGETAPLGIFYHPVNRRFLSLDIRNCALHDRKNWTVE